MKYLKGEGKEEFSVACVKLEARAGCSHGESSRTFIHVLFMPQAALT